MRGKITCRAAASVINDATPVAVSSSMDNVEGRFKWNSYTVILNGNQLDAVEVRLLAPDPANPGKVKIIRQDPYSLNVSEDSTSNLLTGKFEPVSSNAAELMNYDQSGLAPEADNISARFAFNFNSQVEANTIVFRVYTAVQPIDSGNLIPITCWILTSSWSAKSSRNGTTGPTPTTSPPTGAEFPCYSFTAGRDRSISVAPQAQGMDPVAALIDAGEATAPALADPTKSYDRPFYTMGAWEYSYTLPLTYEQAAAKKNILKVDPAFLLLRRDLLNATD